MTSVLAAISYPEGREESGKGELKPSLNICPNFIFLVVGFHYYLYKQSQKFK